MPTPRFVNLLPGRKKAAGGGGGTVIAERRITAVAGTGRYIIEGGAELATTGQKMFQVGDSVPVVFKDGVPTVILGHSWRRAQFDTRIEIPAVSALEIAFIGVIQEQEGFYIATEAGLFAVETGNLEDQTVDVVWGQNPNVLLLKFLSVDEGDIVSRVVKINRSITSTSMPRKTNPITNRPLTFGSTLIPVVDTTTLSQHITIDDVPIGRTVTAKEHLTVRSWIDVMFEEVFTSTLTTNRFPNPRTALKTAAIEFEQTNQISLSPGGLPGYDTLLLHEHVDLNNHLIQTYRIGWRLAEIISPFLPANTKEFLVDTYNAVGFTTVDEVYASVGFTSTPLIIPALNAIQGTFLAVGFFDKPHADVPPGFPGLTLRPNFARVKVRASGSLAWGGFSTGWFDVVVFDRTAGTLLGASFSNPVFEWDNTIDVPQTVHIGRVHLDTFGPVHNDQIGFFRRHSFDSMGNHGPTGFGANSEISNPPTYLVENPTGFLTLTYHQTSTFKNVRASGRDFPPFTRESFLFDEVSAPFNPQYTELASTPGPAIPGLPINFPGFQFVLPNFTRTRKVGSEREFTVPIPSDLRPLLHVGAIVLAAIRSQPLNSQGVQVFRWQLPATVTFPFAERIAVTVPFDEGFISENISKLLAHDAAIYAKFTIGNEAIVLAQERFFSAVPPDDFDLVIPGRGANIVTNKSFANDAAGDRRLYRLAINPDTGLVAASRTTEPTRDLLQGATSVFETSYHFAGVA